MSATVAVVVFPGTNSEDETLRALRAARLDAEIVHWSHASTLRDYDAYVLPGGFSYEDRVRAGAVAAHDVAMDAVIAGAVAGKHVLGICNGAQTLLEAGLVPGTDAPRRPTAAFAPNAAGVFRSVHVHVRLACAPERLPILAGLGAGTVFPMWASHGEGRLAAGDEELARIASAHLAFTYCDASGAPVAAHNGSALDAAAVTNERGTVLAIMPHPERAARARYGPSAGAAFFDAFAAGLR